MDDETYVRRRRWSVEEKRAVVAEALSSGNVIATAKRHGIQAQQIYRWRERLDKPQSATAFLPVSIAPDSVSLSPAPVFAGSSRGAKRAAAMVTLIQTAKLNDVDPQAWLADVLARIAETPQGKLDQLLPWNWRAASTAAIAA